MPRKGMRSIFFKPSPPPPPSPMRSPQRLSTFSVQMMEENLETAQSLIYKWDPHPDPSPFTTQTPLFSPSNSVEAKQYMASVSNLHSAMYFYVSHDPASPNLVLAQNLIQTAMHRLGKEFHRLLKIRPDPIPSILQCLGSPSTTTTAAASLSDFEEDGSAFSEEDVPPSSPSLPSPSRQYPSTDPMTSDLKSIATCMIGCGYGKECTKIYKIIRKSVVDESLYHLGVERLTSSQVQKMDWELLQVKIKNWLAAVKVAVKNVFYSERLLCDAVFSPSNSIKEACYSEVVSEGALNLFAFPENVAKGKKSPEKLFRTLDLYEAVSELWPDIEAIFDSDSASAVRSQSVNCLIKLGEATRAILTEFESAVSKDSSKASVPGGGVHPITRYVMNYLSFLGDYTSSLSDIVADWPLTAPSPLPEAYFGSPVAELENSGDGVVSGNVSVRMAWLVLVLLCKLDGKAERYTDVALSYLFLANNLRYIVSKVRSSNLRFLLGEDWAARHDAKVKQYVSNYERMGWSKVFASLAEGGNASGMALDEVTEKFKRFNGAFDEAYKRQSTWVVTDPKLRDEIKVSLARKIAPIYREFYEMYRGVVVAHVSRGKMFGPGEGIIRFAPDDLGNYLSDLFYAANSNGASVSSLTMSSPSPSAASSFSSSSGHSRGGRSR